MRVLHVVKTSDGAVWAAKQATVLSELGAEVHVALPRLSGNALSFWSQSGAVLHECDLNMPTRAPGKLPTVINRARRLIRDVSPDLVHSHFVGPTLVLRWALGKRHSIPRVFQVPGPLHLEHTLFRRWELLQSGSADYWIGSSRCIVNHYLTAGIPRNRVFLSYYGDQVRDPVDVPRGALRNKASARPGEILVGSISWMYPPKRHLGQHIGIKAHEDLIKALGIVCRKNRHIRGLLAGAPWGGAEWYLEKLKLLAWRAAGDRISFTGALPFDIAKSAWPDLNLAVHVPISENCGGVIEPLLSRVPIIASDVGGLPEVIFDGLTGRLVPPRNPEFLAAAILQCLEEIERYREMAVRGEQLVRTMFDVERTAREVFGIYRHILNGEPPPPEFDSRKLVRELSMKVRDREDANRFAPRRALPARGVEVTTCPR